MQLEPNKNHSSVVRELNQAIAIPVVRTIELADLVPHPEDRHSKLTGALSKEVAIAGMHMSTAALNGSLEFISLVDNLNKMLTSGDGLSSDNASFLLDDLTELLKLEQSYLTKLDSRRIYDIEKAFWYSENNELPREDSASERAAEVFNKYISPEDLNIFYELMVELRKYCESCEGLSLSYSAKNLKEKLLGTLTVVLACKCSVQDLEFYETCDYNSGLVALKSGLYQCTDRCGQAGQLAGNSFLYHSMRALGDYFSVIDTTQKFATTRIQELKKAKEVLLDTLPDSYLTVVENITDFTAGCLFDLKSAAERVLRRYKKDMDAFIVPSQSHNLSQAGEIELFETKGLQNMILESKEDPSAFSLELNRVLKEAEPIVGMYFLDLAMRKNNPLVIRKIAYKKILELLSERELISDKVRAGNGQVDPSLVYYAKAGDSQDLTLLLDLFRLYSEDSDIFYAMEVVINRQLNFGNFKYYAEKKCSEPNQGTSLEPYPSSLAWRRELINLLSFVFDNTEDFLQGAVAEIPELLETKKEAISAFDFGGDEDLDTTSSQLILIYARNADNSKDSNMEAVTEYLQGELAELKKVFLPEDRFSFPIKDLKHISYWHCLRKPFNTWSVLSPKFQALRKYLGILKDLRIAVFNDELTEIRNFITDFSVTNHLNELSLDSKVELEKEKTLDALGSLPVF